MIYRLAILTICIFAISGSWLYAQHSVRDSVRQLIKRGFYNQENERYDAYCFLAEHSTNADTVLYYSNRAIELAEKNNFPPLAAWIHKGTGYLHAGEMANALSAFTTAAELYKKEGNSIGLATAYNYISNTYSNMENHANAIKYLRKAHNIFSKEHDTIREASSLHNLGYEYAQMSSYDSALILYNQAKKVYEQLGYQEGIAYCLGNKGKVFSKQQKLEKAETNLLEAINKLSKEEDYYAIADFMVEYAHVLERKNNVSKAINIARQSYQLAEKNHINEFKRDAAYRLSQLYSSTGQYDSAYYYQGLYLQYKDSIQNLEAVQQMADLRTEYEVAQKQAEVDILQKKRTIQQVVIIALIIIVLLAAGLVYVYYKNLLRTRKLNKELEDSKEELETQQEQLRNLNNIKDKFFSIISHDLRGPISSFSGISMMIKESIENDNKEMLRDIAEYTDQTVISLSGLLDNLLNWALSQQGRFPFEEQVLNTREEINEVVKYLSTVAISKNIHLELSLMDNLLIKADKNSFMTIIRNLLSNAFKFSHKDGTVKIISEITDTDQAKITVEDQGIGIPQDKLQELFTLKEAKSTRGTEQEKGIGLGLTLVYEFVKLNHGEIQVKSTQDKGTRFILHFPRYQENTDKNAL